MIRDEGHTRLWRHIEALAQAMPDATARHRVPQTDPTMQN